MRRGRFFYFLKRLPKKISGRDSNRFLRLSLRTDLPFDAVKRAAALLTVYEREEDRIVDDLNKNLITANDAKTLLTEMLRAELARMLPKQETFTQWTYSEQDARIEALEAENALLKRAARRGNWDAVKNPLENSSKTLSVALPASISDDLGRQATSIKRRLNKIEIEMLEGEDVRQAASSIIAEHSATGFDEFVKSPVLFSHAREQALKNHPSQSMKPNIEAISRLATEFFGDVPVTSITKERQEEFFVWLARLPRNHGKSHGKNRYTANGNAVSKNIEISAADVHDFAITERLRGRNDISIPEKRALLAEELTPRVTISNIRKLRDSLNRLFKGAGDKGIVPPVAMSYKDIESAIKRNSPHDQLYVRVTKPKIRMPWSEERIAALLTCPIFTGCESGYRRWKPGNCIIRDATYWVPLIVLSLGTRIEEILLLKRKNVCFRNGTYCLAIGKDSDQPGKTEDSRRVVPIPQTLLDLGFVQWFQSLTDDHGPLLFPEAARRSENDQLSSAFGKHFRRILSHLDLGDFDEDFYALRKTFSSLLRSADVQDGQRQALAGHRHGSILNLHYTAHKTKDLKAAADQADFKLKIGNHPKLGFPVIIGCTLSASDSLKVEITLTDTHEAASITISNQKAKRTVFEFLRPESCSMATLRQAARDLRKIIAEHPIVLPANASKRAAFEHLQALA